MSLHYIKGDIVFECDDCRDALETYTSNFDAARNLLTREKWKARRTGTEWQHSCFKCQNERRALAPGGYNAKTF